MHVQQSLIKEGGGGIRITQYYGNKIKTKKNKQKLLVCGIITIFKILKTNENYTLKVGTNYILM